jgi:hypothetical protein
MLKYGKLALADGLSGTSGQVASPYGAPDAIEDADDAPPAPAIVLPEVTAPAAEPGAPRRRRTPAASPARSGNATPA